MAANVKGDDFEERHAQEQDPLEKGPLERDPLEQDLLEQDPLEQDPAVLLAMQELSRANEELAQRYPGDSGERQPVHTIYGGAHLFRAGTFAKLGEMARRSMSEYAPDHLAFAKFLELDGSVHDSVPGSGQGSRLGSGLGSGLDSGLSSGLSPGVGTGLGQENLSDAANLLELVYQRVVDKLQREPIEDYRIDFEDGYGFRSDAEEDKHALQAARELALSMRDRSSIPPFTGIRIKPFSEELKQRAVRTLDLFITTLLENADGRLPENFVVTLPKVNSPVQVQVLCRLIELIEERNRLMTGSIKIELMIETPQAITNLANIVRAGRGRVRGAHFGTYDYTAQCGITAAFQTHDHSACDFARNSMQVALAGTGIWLSDGATTTLPIAPHKRIGDEELTDEQKLENREIVHRAWCIHFNNVYRSLINGFYQGWDLHPLQLPARYAACYAFFLRGLEPASIRLKSFVEQAAQASRVGDSFDDAATGQGLLNYFLMALNCGAISEDEAAMSGLTLDQIRSKSFLKILERE